VVRAGGRRRACALYLDLAVRDLSLDISDRHLRRYLCAIISIIATALLPDYTNKDISTEAHYEEPL
jgi:hypothetical protein